MYNLYTTSIPLGFPFQNSEKSWGAEYQTSMATVHIHPTPKYKNIGLTAFPNSKMIGGPHTESRGKQWLQSQTLKSCLLSNIQLLPTLLLGTIRIAIIYLTLVLPL